MWDEKEFFEDFKTESDKIKPDAYFVEKTVKMLNDNSSPTPIWKNKIIFTASAAVFAIVLGIVGFSLLGRGDTESSSNKIAESQVTLKNEARAEKSSETEVVSVDLYKLDEITQWLSDSNVIVTDVYGNPIDEEERMSLKNDIEAGKYIYLEKMDPSNNDVVGEYKLIGDRLIKLKLISDKYICIE